MPIAGNRDAFIFRQPNKDAKLIFLHIPKAAGSTFNTIIRMRYRSSKVKDFQARHIENEVRDFIAEAADVRTKYSVILGHVPFGLHRYMDSGTGYLSVIRNPVDRLVSDY